MKFISDLKEILYPDNAVTRLMEPVIINEPKKSKKLMWIILTGILLLGCSYFSYRYNLIKMDDDD